MSNLALKWCQTPFGAGSNSNQLKVLPQGDPRSRVYEKRGHPVRWRGESKTGSKKHLRSVSLALLSMAPCTSIHSVLRLGGVQQHLSRLCWGWSGAPLPWDWRWRAAGWPSRQLYLRQRGVTINLATRRNMMNRLYLDSCQKINWCYQKIKHIHIGLKNPHSPDATWNGQVQNKEGTDKCNVDGWIRGFLARALARVSATRGKSEFTRRSFL